MPVRVEKVNKHIGKQQVLKDISFTLNEGEIVGLLGPNGAGKSTLMKILCGVWEADPEARTEKRETRTESQETRNEKQEARSENRELRDGKGMPSLRVAVGVGGSRTENREPRDGKGMPSLRVAVGVGGSRTENREPRDGKGMPSLRVAVGVGGSRTENREPRSEKRERITVPARIGYLPEQNPLYEDMYIAEYLQFMANISVIGYRLSVIGKDEIEDLIRRVGLTPERNKHIRELSKGYKQRVGLAQALMGQPELLVLDEPTTGLDPNQLTEIRALIRQEASEKRTILLSTHILQEVEALCDRVIIIDHGEIKADLRMEEIEDLEELFRQKTSN